MSRGGLLIEPETTPVGSHNSPLLNSRQGTITTFYCQLMATKYMIPQLTDIVFYIIAVGNLRPSYNALWLS